MGGGGAGGAPAAGGIGGGGGAGGSGGNGGYYCTTAGYPQNPSGGIGYGGLSADGARNGQDGWFTAANGGGERWFDASGAADFGCYATVGDTTLYASWSDTPGFDAADYRLCADGIGIDGDEVVIPFHAVISANLGYALEFVKVRSSRTLPIPANGPAASATLETLDDGGKAMVVPFDPTAPSMFYRLDIDVED